MPPRQAVADAEAVRWRAFVICMTVSALTILDISKVNVALPAIEQSMGAGPTALQLITAGYALSYGITLVPAGRLGDLHSRRRLLLIGVAGFTLASALCALAPTLETLVAARLLQGAAAGIQMPQAIGLIQQIFPASERGRAFGYFGASVGISAAIGPAVGGLLIALGSESDGWRGLFLLNVPVGVIVLILAIKYLPKRPPQASPQSRGLDGVGTGLLTVATFSFMLPFVFTTGDQSDTPSRWLWLVLAGGAFVGFIRWERAYQSRGKAPLIDFSLFQHRSFKNGVIIAAGYYSAMPATFLITMIFLQKWLELSPLSAGLAAVPFALMSALGSSLVGRYAVRHGRLLVSGGLILAAIAFALIITCVSFAPRSAMPWLIVASLALAGGGSGMATSANQTLTLESIPVEHAGVAGSVSQVGQRLGTAVGTSIAAAVFFSRSAAASPEQAHTQLVGAYLAALTVTLGILVATTTVSLWDKRRHVSE